MSRRSIWKTLGIARTEDRAEIRRAYANRLRETHPEDDPQGFQALREAYEIALNEVEGRARWAAYQAEQEALAAVEAEAEPQALEPVGQDLELADGEWDDAPPPRFEPQAPPQLDPIAAQRQADLAQHNAALSRLAGLVKDAAKEKLLTEALAEVFASPAMDSVSVHSDTERWLAQLVLSAAPNADALIDPMARQFGWNAAQRRWDTPYEVGAVLARYEDYSLLRRLKRGEHYHFRAYRVLMKAPSSLSPLERLRLGRHREVVGNFLKFLRTYHPQLAQALDPEALAWWDARLGDRPRKSQGRSWPFGLITVVVFLVVVVSHLSQAPTSGFEPMASEVTGVTPGDPIGHLKARVLRRPTDAGAQAELCRGRALLGLELTEGLAGCDAALNLDRESLTALEGRALIKARLRQWTGAQWDYDTIVAHKPNDARALYGRGVARIARGMDSEGRADILRAEVIDPTVRRTFDEYDLRAPPEEELAGLKKPKPPGPKPSEDPVRFPAGTKLERAKLLERPSQAQMEPLFPVAAQASGAGGKVLLRCRIGVSGLLDDCIVWSEAPADMGFGEAALKASAFYRFTPTLVDGKPYGRATVLIPFTFKGWKEDVAAKPLEKPAG